MVKSDENNLMLSSSMVILQDETRRGNRRALGVINQNLVAARAYPCVVNKRGGLSDWEQKGCEKKKLNSLNPSISRCQYEKETKKLKPSNPNTNNFGDCIFIDEEEEEDDKAMPMSLEESYIEESDPMEEEIEMEDIMLEEPILNIDDQDANNPLAVVEYIEDLYRFYRETESSSCVPQDYMTGQFDITDKMRAILIDWLIEVHDKFELLNETLFLTVNLIDRFLSKQSIARKSLQLVGLVALLLACKYEEVSVPSVEDLVTISDNAYTRQDVLDMEKIMLNTLQFNVSLPTQYPFLKRFLKAAQSNEELEMMAKFLIELALVDYEMLCYPPSLLAATAVYTAQCTVLGFRQWSRTCEIHTHYSQDQLLECSRKMVNLHHKAGTENLKGVYRKYDSDKFGYIAIRYKAAHFLV